MPIVTLRTELLSTQRNSNAVGFITFSYNDQAGIGEAEQEPVFRLTRLSIEFLPGTLDIDGVRDGINRDRSQILSNQQLAVEFAGGRFQEGGNFRVLELQEDRPYWRFQVLADPALDLMIFTPARRNTLVWDLLNAEVATGDGRAPSRDRITSGVLGITVMVPPEIVVVPPEINHSVFPAGIRLPNQSPPVSRLSPVNVNLLTATHPNPNDPMRFSVPDQCGCHLLSIHSASTCLTACSALPR